MQRIKISPFFPPEWTSIFFTEVFIGRGTFQCLQKVRHIRGGRPLPPDSPLAIPCLLFFPRVRILTSVFPPRLIRITSRDSLMGMGKKCLKSSCKVTKSDQGSSVCRAWVWIRKFYPLMCHLLDTLLGYLIPLLLWERKAQTSPNNTVKKILTLTVEIRLV